MRSAWRIFSGACSRVSVYGVLIALAGCLRGIQCGNSSSAVGDAATSAVVTGIVAIVDGVRHFCRRVLRPRDLRIRSPEKSPEGEKQKGNSVSRLDLNVRRARQRKWSEGPYHREQSHHGVRQFCIDARSQFHDQPRRYLHHHGWQRLRQEHLAQTSDRSERTGAGRTFSTATKTSPRRIRPKGRRSLSAYGHAISERRAVELDDAGGKRRACRWESTPT